MMHHHANFGNKRFSGSEEIIWTFTDIWNLCCDPHLNRLIQVAPKMLWFIMYHQSKIGYKKDQQFRRYGYSKNSHILIT